MATVLILIFLLQVKHLILDYIVVPPEDWKVYFHVGGSIHSGLNAIGTTLCFALVGTEISLLLIVLILDYIAHYNIDFLKQTVHRLWGYTTNARYRFLIGMDQFLHQITYLTLMIMILKW